MTRAECFEKIMNTTISKDIKSVIDDLSIATVDVDFVHKEIKEANLVYYPNNDDMYIPLIVKEDKIEILVQDTPHKSLFLNLGLSVEGNRLVNTYIRRDGITVREEVKNVE